jgi:hypothetical protein
MRRPRFLLSVFAGAILCVPFTVAIARTLQADPNSPDSVSIPSIPWRGDTIIALSVSTTTDDSLSVAQLVFAWPNAALRVDSVRFNAGRWNVPGYHRWSKPTGSDTLVVSFLPTQKRLPPGSGVVALVYCGRDSAYTFDADFDVGEAVVEAAAPRAPFQTVFADLPGPSFVPSTILGATSSFSPCICPEHGNLNDDSAIDAVDLAIVIDGVFFGGALPETDPECPHIHRGDISCDNSYDAVDLAIFIDHIFFGGPPPCDPCEDL